MAARYNLTGVKGMRHGAYWSRRLTFLQSKCGPPVNLSGWTFHPVINTGFDATAPLVSIPWRFETDGSNGVIILEAIAVPTASVNPPLIEIVLPARRYLWQLDGTDSLGHRNPVLSDEIDVLPSLA